MIRHWMVDQIQSLEENLVGFQDLWTTVARARFPSLSTHHQLRQVFQPRLLLLLHLRGAILPQDQVQYHMHTIKAT